MIALSSRRNLGLKGTRVATSVVQVTERRVPSRSAEGLLAALLQVPFAGVQAETPETRARKEGPCRSSVRKGRVKLNSKLQ